MKMNKKTALIIGGGILLLGVGFFIFKKIRAKRKYSMGELPNQSGQGAVYSGGGGSSSSGGGGTTSTFNPDYAVGQLHKSMKGFGTDDDLFWSTARGLTKEQRELVKDAFDKKYGSLKDWIEGDFSWGDEDDALELFGL